MPSGPMASWAGQAIFGSSTIDRAGLEPVERLLDDPQRLVHLGQPRPGTGVQQSPRSSVGTSKSKVS